MSIRYWLAALIFACGAASGATAVSFGASRAPAAVEPAAPPAAQRTPPAAGPDVAGMIARVAGRDARGDAVVGGAREPAEALRSEAGDVDRLAPSAIARRALGFTVFVRAGSVYGAGALLDRAGHVVTCRHVVRDLDRVTVAFADGTSVDARVVDRDAQLDLALLRIAPADEHPLPEPAGIAAVEPGDELFALGAPRKMAFSLARGMASYVGRPYNGAYYLQTDLPMNAGSSGGPVLNDRGQLVAIASFVLRDSEGLAFALPIDYAYRRFSDRLEAPAAVAAGAGAFEGWLSALARTRRGAAEHDD